MTPFFTYRKFNLRSVKITCSAALLSFIFSSLGYFPLEGQELSQLLQQGQEGVIVDLREPLYTDGVLSTENGGVIKAGKIRIQAEHLSYTRKMMDQQFVWTIEGEGSLIVEFGEYIFVGDKLVYDFQTKEGVIYQGITAVEPWFFGGERLELKPDGSFLIYNGYITTSERDVPDWGIYSQIVEVESDRYMKAQHISFKAFDFTVLKIPALRANLNSIFDSPIRYRFRWGGRQGPRFGFTYEIFSWESWKTFVRFDYRLTRGPGGGIETYYHSKDRKTQFQSISYLAKDSSILDPHEKARYRFEGVFKKLIDEDKTSILFTYDKISDKDMPSVYYDRDFDFDTAERTQIRLRRQEDQWIANLYARARVNSFQTVKQELPTLEANFKPFEFKDTGVFFENYASASYLNFEYSKYLLHVHNYSSSRLQYLPSLYRPIVFGPFFTLTPEVGMTSLLYGDTPKDGAQWLVQGRGGVELQTQLFRYYGSFKHIIEPYAAYRYYSSPSISADEHYIFDLSDGLTRLEYLSFGVNNAFYTKQTNYCSSRILSADIYTFAFFDTHKIRQTIPRVYGSFSYLPFQTLKYTLNTAWNIEHHQLDYFNFRTEWTLNEDFAIAAEYRHRGSYWWRKVDRENFFLDMFQSEERLRYSPLSDRCDTVLLHLFYRFHPNWACELTSRHGCNRRHEPNYFEFEIDVLTTIQTAWNLRFSYQHQENDDRVAMYLNIGLKRPSIPQEKATPIFCFE